MLAKLIQEEKIVRKEDREAVARLDALLPKTELIDLIDARIDLFKATLKKANDAQSEQASKDIENLEREMKESVNALERSVASLRDDVGSLSTKVQGIEADVHRTFEDQKRAARELEDSKKQAEKDLDSKFKLLEKCLNQGGRDGKNQSDPELQAIRYEMEAAKAERAQINAQLDSIKAILEPMGTMHLCA